MSTTSTTATGADTTAVASEAHDARRTCRHAHCGQQIEKNTQCDWVHTAAGIGPCSPWQRDWAEPKSA